MAITLDSIYWYGHKASEYAQEHGYLDYKTFAEAFPHILANDLIGAVGEISKGNEFFEVVNGCEYDEETDEYTEIYQYYIVPGWAVEEIFEDTDEIIFYNEALDLYLWGVTHYGTSWDYVLTDIKINAQEEK